MDIRELQKLLREQIIVQQSYILLRNVMVLMDLLMLFLNEKQNTLRRILENILRDMMRLVLDTLKESEWRIQKTILVT